MKQKRVGCITLLIAIALIVWLPLIDVSLVGLATDWGRDLIQDGLRQMIVQLIEWQHSGATPQIREAAAWVLAQVWPRCAPEEQLIIQRYLEIQREKNASAPLPNGTLAGAEVTANTAIQSARSARAN